MSNEHLLEIIKELYTDVFANNQCQVVDQHYHPDTVAYFNGKELTTNDLKASLAKFLSEHENIKTEIADSFASDNKTFARLIRTVTNKESGKERSFTVMVVKHFEANKVKKIWFMTDDPMTNTTWTNR